METRSNFGSQKFGTTKIRNDNEDSYASINLPLTLSPPSARADTLEASFFGAQSLRVGVRLAILRFSISCQSLVKSYGHVGREFELRPFSAGSVLTLRNRIEPLTSTTSVERTPRKMQSTKLTPSITAPGKLVIHITRGLFVLLTFSRLTLNKKSRVSAFDSLRTNKSTYWAKLLTRKIRT